MKDKEKLPILVSAHHASADFGHPERHLIWKPSQEPTREERQFIFEQFYQKYHDRMLHGVQTFTKPGVVIGWDNTAHYEIGQNEAGRPEMMKAIILSNRGDEDKATSSREQVSCDPEFLEEVAFQLRIALKKYNLPDEVRLNLVYKGGYIPKHYNTLINSKLDVSQPIQAFQVEYDTALTHDQITLRADYRNMIRLKKAFEETMYTTYANFLR